MTKGNLRKRELILAYSSRKTQVYTGRPKAWWRAGGMWAAGKGCLDLWAWSTHKAEREKTGNVDSSNIQRAPPVALFPQKATSPNLFEQCHQLGTKCSNIWPYGVFSAILSQMVIQKGGRHMCSDFLTKRTCFHKENIQVGIETAEIGHHKDKYNWELSSFLEWYFKLQQWKHIC